MSYYYLTTVSLLLLAFVSSLFFSGITQPWFAPAIVGVSVLFGISLWQAKLFPKSSVVYFILCWWGYLGITCFTAIIPFNAILFFSIFSIVPLLFFAAILDKDTEKWLNISWNTLLFAGAVLAVWALVQFFVLPEQYGSRIHNPFSNPNTLGGLFTLILLPVVGAYFTNQKSKLFLVLAVLFFAGLLVTNSRGAMLSGLISFILLATFCIKENNFYKNLIVIIVSFLAVYIGIHFIVPANEFALIDNFGSINQRIKIWSSSIEMIKNNLLWGTGLGSFYAFYPTYRAFNDISSGFWAHSDPLQFWIELGVLGPVIFYSLLVAVLFRTIKAFENVEYRTQILLPFSGLLACLLHTHITFHLYQPAILIPLSVLLARWYFITGKALREEQKPLNINQNIKQVIAVLLVLGFSFWIIRAGAGVYLVNSARQELIAGNIEKFANLINKADKFSPRSYAMPSLYIAEFHSSILRQVDINLSQEDYETSKNIAEELINNAEKQNPKEPAIQNAKANLYAVTGRKDEAFKIWQNNLKNNPRHIASRMALADILLERGENKQAFKLLENGLLWAYAKDTRDYYQKTLNTCFIVEEVNKCEILKKEIKEFHLLKSKYPNISITPLKKIEKI